MIANRWQSLRFYLLATTLISVVLVLVKSILFPANDKQKFTPFEFPSTVPLSEWQAGETTSVTIPENAPFVAATNYQYFQDNLSFDITMYYLMVEDGGMKLFTEKYAYGELTPGKVTLRHQEQTGFYAFWNTENRVNLGACINPRGGTSVTPDQFRQNHNIHDLTFSRILLWLIGRVPLRDWRCIWTTLSVPIEPGQSPEEVYPMLEQAWFAWAPWWQSRFPQP